MADWDWIEESASPQGFRAAGVRAGIKTAGRDLALIVSDTKTVSAALFTQSRFCAAPVILSREHAAAGDIAAIIANSGCANACTGDPGLADAREMAALTGETLGLDAHRVLVASTGIIGHPLPMDRIRAAIPKAAQELSVQGLGQAAEAILTTDTESKQAALRVEIDGSPVTIAGMVKGAGMTAPRMATVFAFFVTDAACDRGALQGIFRRVMDRSINRVTVDGDTSTNDTACILANGASGGSHIAAGSASAGQFEEAFSALACQLARKLARGGEGAHHLVTVRVTGAATEADAERIARTIADSPLVKTAIFGRDPNWGRIAMAAGRAGVPFDPRDVEIQLNGFPVMCSGQGVPFPSQEMADSLAGDEITIGVSLNAGAAEAEVWTCDLSYGYVEINAEYHT